MAYYLVCRFYWSIPTKDDLTPLPQGNFYAKVIPIMSQAKCVEGRHC